MAMSKEAPRGLSGFTKLAGYVVDGHIHNRTTGLNHSNFKPAPRIRHAGSEIDERMEEK